MSPDSESCPEGPASAGPSLFEPGGRAPGVRQRERRVVLDVSAGGLVKLALFGALVWAAICLWSAFCLLLLAVLIAVTLNAPLAQLERWGLSRQTGVLLLAGAVFGALALVLWLALPPLASQLLDLFGKGPAVTHAIRLRLPASANLTERLNQVIADLPSSPAVAEWLKSPQAWGPALTRSVTGALLVLVLSFYLLLDGRRLVAWLLAYVPRQHRQRMAATVPAVSDVLMAYTGGQLVLALLFTGFTFTVLTVLGVPAALPLALVAGLFDVVPFIGIIVATAPAALLAMTVSPAAALSVLALYVLYHQLEVYVLQPRIYGGRLQLSTLAVLISAAVGFTLHGAVGAVLALPLAAAYPVLERYWLHEYLDPAVASDHSALREALEEDHDLVVAAVLRGDEEPRVGPGPTG